MQVRAHLRVAVQQLRGRQGLVGGLKGPEERDAGVGGGLHAGHLGRQEHLQGRLPLPLQPTTPDCQGAISLYMIFYYQYIS